MGKMTICAIPTSTRKLYVLYKVSVPTKLWDPPTWKNLQIGTPSCDDIISRDRAKA